MLSFDTCCSHLHTRRAWLEGKVTDQVRFKLRRRLSRSERQEMVSHVITRLLERVHAGQIHFPTPAKLEGYVLAACWFNYRDQHAPPRQAGSERQEDWYQEGIAGTILPLLKEDQDQQTFDESEEDQEDYYQLLTWQVIAHLDECLLARRFSFRDVSIFKSYLLNQQPLKDVAAESDFSSWVVRKAVREISAYLATIQLPLLRRGSLSEVNGLIDEK